MVNPTVFFDTAVDSEPLGHILFKLFADKVPKTAENFHALSTGENDLVKRVPAFAELFLGLCARVMTSQAIMALVASLYMKHTGLGVLSTANAGPNTNGSRCFICTAKTKWLAGKYAVFGKVKEGMASVEPTERFGSSSGKTSQKITTADCGQV